MQEYFKRSISFTELQKLSSKKLKKANLPLMVIDRKSNKQGFVILDAASFEQMQSGVVASTKHVKSPHKSGAPDFRALRLLWDRPLLTNRQFGKYLHDAQHLEHAWAVKRVLEYAPSPMAVRWLTLSEIQQAVQEIPLRPIFREAWRHAVHYWTKKS